MLARWNAIQCGDMFQITTTTNGCSSCVPHARSKVEGEAQFGPRPQDKTSRKAPLAQYLLSSYVAVTHPFVIDIVRLFVGLNRPTHTVACTQAVLDPSVPEDQQRQEELQPFFHLNRLLKVNISPRDIPVAL